MSYRSLLPPLWYSVITITLYFVFGFFGFVVASAKVKGHRKILDSRALRSHEKINSGTPKVIDTSVTIDGRILDIMRAGSSMVKLSFRRSCSMNSAILQILAIISSASAEDEG